MKYDQFMSQLDEADKKLTDDALPHDVANHFIRNLPSKGIGVKSPKFDLKPTPGRRGRA